MHPAVASEHLKIVTPLRARVQAAQTLCGAGQFPEELLGTMPTSRICRAMVSQPVLLLLSLWVWCWL